MSARNNSEKRVVKAPPMPVRTKRKRQRLKSPLKTKIPKQRNPKQKSAMPIHTSSISQMKQQSMPVRYKYNRHRLSYSPPKKNANKNIYKKADIASS